PMRAMCEYLRSRNPGVRLQFARAMSDYDRRLGDISFGAPVSNQLAAARLGYSGYGERLLFDTSHEFGFYYVQDVGEVKQRCQRYSSGEAVSTPNSFIVDPTTGKKYAPEVDKQGFLSSDYLLVSRFFRDGKPVSVIGGTHGPGTRAFGCLLHDKRECDNAVRGIGDHRDSFQSLFRVTGMAHDHIAKQSSGRLTIEHLETKVLFRSYDRG